MFYYIKETRNTPIAIISNGAVRISGKATDTGDVGFFNRINYQIRRYAKNPERKTNVDICLSCMNSRAKRSLVKVFQKLEDVNSHGHGVTINWYYQNDDEEMKEIGEIYSDMFRMNINMVSTT